MKKSAAKIGARVYWNDPDEGVCSGFGVIVDAPPTDELEEDSIISLKMDDDGEVEAWLYELEGDEP
jgi:hypothetical protein